MMSKMNELSLEQQEASYELFIEAQRDELRSEGAEEMRIEILRAIDAEMIKVWDKQQKFGLQVAKVLVEQAAI
jgi:hypothetical protein